MNTNRILATSGIVLVLLTAGIVVVIRVSPRRPGRAAVDLKWIATSRWSGLPP